METFPASLALCGETTGHRWIPLTKASDAELWYFLWSAPEQRWSKQSTRRWFETGYPSETHLKLNLSRSHSCMTSITTVKSFWNFAQIMAMALHDDVIKWKQFPRYWPLMPSFDVFFDLYPNKRLRKQSWGWWFETLSRPLWRHCNDRPPCKILKWFIEWEIRYEQTIFREIWVKEVFGTMDLRWVYHIRPMVSYIL